MVIRKQSKNDHIIEGARLLREKGIKVLTTNMIGLPGETLDNALETVELNMVLKSDYVRANTFLLFPGLPLVEHARQKGYVDKDFDIDRSVAQSQDITLNTPYAKEFKNLVALLAHGEIHAAVDPVLPAVVALPDNILFRIIGSFNMVQELLFWSVRPIPALRYFHNTVLMTRRSAPARRCGRSRRCSGRERRNTGGAASGGEANRGTSDVHDGGIGPAIPDAPLPGMAAAVPLLGTLAWLLLR